MEKEEFEPETIRNERKLRPERKKTLNLDSDRHPNLNWFLRFCDREKKDNFVKTTYFSGDMASIILVQRRIKYWVAKVRKK